MAQDKTTRSGDEPTVSDALADGQSDLDEALKAGRTHIAGYIPADAPVEPVSESEAVAVEAVPTDAEETTEDPEDLPGEELARDLDDPEPYEVVDDEAEELIEADEPTDEVEPYDEAEDQVVEEPEDDDGPADEIDDLDAMLEGESTEPLDLADLDDEPEFHIDDPGQLADAEAVAVAAKSTRPVRRKKSERAEVADDDMEDEDAPVARPVRKTATATAPARKTKPTPSRKEAAPAARGWTSPAQFVRESAAELRKVVWPTGPQVQQYFLVVLVFVLFIIAFVGLLDFGLGWLLLKLLG